MRGALEESASAYLHVASYGLKGQESIAQASAGLQPGLPQNRVSPVAVGAKKLFDAFEVAERIKPSRLIGLAGRANGDENPAVFSPVNALIGANVATISPVRWDPRSLTSCGSDVAATISFVLRRRCGIRSSGV